MVNFIQMWALIVQLTFEREAKLRIMFAELILTATIEGEENKCIQLKKRECLMQHAIEECRMSSNG